VKDQILRFNEKSRDELIQDILDREKKIEEQEKQIAELKAKLGKKSALDEHKQFLKAERLAKIKDRPKAPGQKAGHIGVTREKPKQIDRVVEQILTKCPDCDHRLSGSQEVVEHVQEDIVPARVQVTCYKKHRYYCKQCQKLVTAPCAEDEIPNSYLGPVALIQTVILKYHHALPFNKIAEVFEGLCGLKVSEGGLAQALQRVSEWLAVEESEILKAIRISPHVYMDETGWKISGRKHWVWAAANEKLAHYRIAVSRGAKVAKEIIGTEYEGTIGTDFYAAYNRLPGKKQRCLVHLLRTMKEYRIRDQSAEFVRYEKILKRIVWDAIHLGERRKKLEEEVYKRRVKRIKKRLFAWSVRDYKNKNLIRLTKRFLKHWAQLLTFLEYPDVSYHNNLAERMIRPNVIIRNRSFQNRSQKGAQAHGIHMSIIQTLRLQKRNLFTELKAAYLHRRQGNITPILNFASIS
jgi:transposase